MIDLPAKLGVLVRAIPAWGAAVQGVLVAFAAGVVPLLPVDVGLKVGAAVASLIAVVASVVRVVSSVTPVPPSQRGLLPTNLRSGGRMSGPPGGAVHFTVAGTVPDEPAFIDSIRRAIRRGERP